MAEALPNEKLRQYLRELKPEARALLATELERAQLRGENPPGAAMILEELRAEQRDAGRKLPPRLSNPQRLFFAAIEPFFVDDAPERKHRGRISRACLNPIWEWICRDLMPAEAATYTDQVNVLLAANGKKDAEQVARAFQDLAEQRMREMLDAAKSDDKVSRRIAGQIGTRRAIEDVREIAAILKVRDALGVIASRLPQSINNLADDQLENVKNLLESPIGRHRDVFLYALLLVMDRLASPWQLIRLAIHAAGSDAAARIAATPFAVAVEIVLTDVERMIAALRESVRAGRASEVAIHLKDVHDTVRGLRTELDFTSDSNWSRQLSAFRADVSKLLQAEIENLPAQVRRVLRPRPLKETGPDATLDASDVEEIEAKLVLAAACRNYSGELAFSETTRRVHSDLQNYFDSGTQVLIDRLRTSPPAERSFRQSQANAAVRFCAKLFGDDFASTLAKAADVAAKGDQKAKAQG
jgi:flagellin-specific chaperone FliS